MSRTQNSIKNFICAMIGQAVGILINFITRIFFIRTLGNEYLGLNGLFSNILTVLSLAELGIGTAIVYSLYAPLAIKDIKKCKMLMQLYKKIYTVIGCIILIIGSLITPLLPTIIKDMPDIPNINLIYILFVINTGISYFYSYKKDLIAADQNRYIVTIYHYGCYAILNILQIIYLLLTKNYLGYLIIQILMTLLENILISRKANKMYPFLKEKTPENLDQTTKNEIIKNTKAMMMHKVGSVVVNSTDNILLSTYVGLSAVGIYSNYYLIISALNSVLGQIYVSITASVGNLFANSSKERQYTTFKNINFLTFWIYSFASTCLLILFNPFIEIWLGKEYLFDMKIVLTLVINFYITGMRKSVLTFREAAGLFAKDKYKPIIESIINLVTSIILALKFGVIGIFIGTFISSITTCVWVEPYVLYKYGFQKKISLYFKAYFKELILTILISTLTFSICSLVNLNIYLSFILKCVICLIVPNLILYIIFRKTKSFQYFYDKVFKIYLKLKRKAKYE